MIIRYEEVLEYTYKKTTLKLPKLCQKVIYFQLKESFSVQLCYYLRSKCENALTSVIELSEFEIKREKRNFLYCYCRVPLILHRSTFKKKYIIFVTIMSFEV